MQINNSTPTFCAKFRTINILETTVNRTMESETISNLRPVILELWDKPFKATGNRGYRYFLGAIGERIISKYPNIAEATAKIKTYMANNPNAAKKDINNYAQSLIKELGEEIDIIL